MRRGVCPVSLSKKAQSDSQSVRSDNGMIARSLLDVEQTVSGEVGSFGVTEERAVAVVRRL